MNMNPIIEAFTSAFGEMANFAIAGITALVPVVLPMLAAVILVGFLIKVVRRITGR